MKAYMVVLATSLVGAYAIVRGISVFAGGYPDESYVMMLINHGEFQQFGRVFGSKIYLYIGLIFVFTAIGFGIQSFFIPSKDDEKPVVVEKEKTEETTTIIEKKPDGKEEVKVTEKKDEVTTTTTTLPKTATEKHD